MNLIAQLEQEEITRLGRTIPDFSPATWHMNCRISSELQNWYSAGGNLNGLTP
ncbi:MAG: hypothetical protein NTY41_07765 [Proteobacteria bacterium]|nr:hypothetical protein [Pseudomonadota bacterium]